jgi:sporulation protein YlmC with PRC-barrel domain
VNFEVMKLSRSLLKNGTDFGRVKDIVVEDQKQDALTICVVSL